MRLPGFAAAPAGVLLAVGGAASYGVTDVIGRRLASEGLASATALAVRFAIAAAVLCALLAVRRAALAPPRHSAAKIFALGAVGYAAQSTLLYMSLERGTAASCILLFYAYPAIAILLGWALRQGRPSRATLIAAALAAAGTVLVACSSGPLTISSAGVVLALGSACVFAVYVLAGSSLGRGLDAMTIAAWMAAGAALASVVRGMLEHSLSAPAGYWPLLIAYGVMTAAAFSLLFAAIARLGAGRAAVVMTLEAFFAVALAALFLGEAITLGQAIGGVGILAATAVIGRARGARTVTGPTTVADAPAPPPSHAPVPRSRSRRRLAPSASVSAHGLAVEAET